MSRHHIIPISRRNRKRNKRMVALPVNFHEAWHTVFQDLTPEEVLIYILKLQNLMENREEIDWKDINLLIQEVKFASKQTRR